MKGIPLNISNSPSLPNQIYNATDNVISLNHDNKPNIVSPQPKCPKKTSSMTFSASILNKPPKVHEEMNRSLPHLRHFKYPKTRKSSQIIKNRPRFNGQLFSKNLHTNSTPVLKTPLLNLPVQPLERQTNEIEINKPPEEKFCKICFENIENKKTGKLINPCKCTGTVRYIHEECLKTWQVSQKKDIKNAECELCHCKYSMDFKMGLRFYPRQAIEDGLLSFISSLCLFILIATLISIIIIFAIQLNDPQGIFSQNKRGDDSGGAYKLGILISCCVITFILSILLILSMKEACFISQVTRWSVFNYEKEEKPHNDFENKKNKKKNSKIFPRSNSDNMAMMRQNSKIHENIQTKIVKVNVVTGKIKLSNNHPENIKEPDKLGNPKKDVDKPLNFQEFIIKSQIRDYQRNVIRFNSNSSSEKSLKMKTPLDRKTLPLNQEDKKNLEGSTKKNVGKGDAPKYELLKLSSINSNSSKSSIASKLAIKEQFANHLPKEFINANDDKEKFLDVVMNQRKSSKNEPTKTGMLIDLLQSSNKKKLKYAGVKKSFYLFKKQTVFEEKAEDSKSKSNSSGHFETVVKK